MSEPEVIFRCRDCIPTNATVLGYKLLGHGTCSRCGRRVVGDGFYIDKSWDSPDVTSFTTPEPYEDEPAIT